MAEHMFTGSLDTLYLRFGLGETGRSFTDSE